MLRTNQDWRADITEDSEIGRLLRRRDGLQGARSDVQYRLNTLHRAIDAAQRTMREATADKMLDDAFALQYVLAQARLPILEQAQKPVGVEVNDYSTTIRNIDQEISELLARYRELEDALAGRKRIYVGRSQYSLSDEEIKREMKRLIGRAPGETINEQATTAESGHPSA